MEFHLTDKLQYLCEKYDTPLQLYDEKMIRENVRELIKTFSEKFFFKQFFAVKALPNPVILKILLEEGCGLDCSSTSELYIAEKLGVSGENIMFTSNYTSKNDLKKALDINCIINLDDLSLVHDLNDVASQFPKLISFRLNPGIGKTHSETSSNILGVRDVGRNNGKPNRVEVSE